jgi:DNA helicase-2/ATP-dependent DNA helicase PcrA
MNLTLSAVAKAALEHDGPVLVTGGPGSGKTTLALLKAQRLVAALKPGQEILFLSFSRAAVRQVLVRCKDVLTAEERRHISIRTYHAFCMDLLKSHGRLLTGQPARILFPGPERLAKSVFSGDWDAELERLAREESRYAFSAFAGHAADLLGRSQCVRELIADTYPIVILDEFQDTDDPQWALVQELARGSLLITLADPDQRIFEYDDKVDPLRLDHLRATLAPAEFDLRGINHRSPNAGILGFADAVLRDTELPVTSDVVVRAYYSNAFEGTVHAGVVWMLSALRKEGIQSPSVAVLARSNPFVGDLSQLLTKENIYNGQRLSPVEHHVVWDAELSAAAAQVIASILEWPERDEATGVATTLETIADFYDMKNAVRPSRASQRSADTFRTAAEKVRTDGDPRPTAVKAIKAAFAVDLVLRGDPATDWLTARAIIQKIDVLRDVFGAVRFVRLFRATDEIGGRLGRQWAETGTYGNAREIVRRTINDGRLIASETEPKGVVLMTMHKAKGKEFDGVTLVEGKWVGKFFDERKEKPPYEPSRRLLRVGITRARSRVAIIRPHGALPL